MNAELTYKDTLQIITVDRQRALINLLCNVTLLRRGPGRYETPAESVKGVWK